MFKTLLMCEQSTIDNNVVTNILGILQPSITYKQKVLLSIFHGDNLFL